MATPTPPDLAEPLPEVVTFNGEDLALLPDEAFALEYLRRLSERRGLAAEDHRVTAGAIHAIVTAGRLRRGRLEDLAAPAPEPPKDLNEVRALIRYRILRVAVEVNGPVGGDTPELAELVAAYNGLGGDLEHDARPKGPSDIELAAAAVVRAAANLGAEFFPGRLEVLVEPLNDLAETIRGRRHLAPVEEPGK